MQDSQADFNKRLSTLNRKHAAMSQGFSTALRADGLIVIKPNRALRRAFPIKGLLALVFGFFVFKAIMLSSLSEITYNERVAKLNQGGALEQAGAWLMQVEPVTHFLAGFLEPLID
ncbi:hypothetical protein ACERZ8_11445 [Tateyamaria armeniaca]|uniref:Uncharacterized protein n=1 Tax=Tateyamaria armeniaca TaxID=2518930 RepID=A0ABW8UTM6_9RHOB